MYPLATGNQVDYPLEKMARMPSLKERMDLAVKRAEEQLESAKRAREILNQHPELEELLNIFQKGHF